MNEAENPARRVMRLIERTIVDLGFCHKHGNPLLLPDYELEGWTTTLPQSFTMQDIIDLIKTMPRTSSSIASSRPTWIWSDCPVVRLTPTCWCALWLQWR